MQEKELIKTGDFIMQKYILYDNPLSVENILDVADTEDEIREQYRMAKIFRRMVHREDFPQMALVEMSEEELEMILGNH